MKSNLKINKGENLIANLPAISIIIPMCNAEKYIAECLENILSQTFQDYEVIIVNDCSTDDSVEIAESYFDKFGGHLKLTHMRKNSGSGRAPRNKGIKISRGEYVFFIDSDDMIIPTALVELYRLARNVFMV